MFLPRQLGEKVQLKPGDHLTLEHVHQRRDFRVAGMLAPEGLALAEGGMVALTDIATMQEFTGRLQGVDRIDLLLRPSATPSDLREIQDLLPEGVVLRPPAEAKQSGRFMIRAYQLNLSVLSFVSLFVGMFLVYSLVALNAASRRHELAILRSIGGSSRLLFLLFLAEGAMFGIVGWLLAIPFGSVLVRQLLKGVSQTISNLFVRVQVDRLQLDAGELLLSFLLTVFIALAAAYQPAREAMQVAPKEALSLHEAPRTRRRSVQSLAWVGCLLILCVWPLSQAPGPAGLPLPGYIATFLLFSGFSLLSPWFLHQLGSHLPPLLRRLAGQPAYLAGRYLRDAGTRTAISVGALITAMALFVALAVMVHSFRSTVETWVEQSIGGDLFIAPRMAAINEYREPLPEPLVAHLKSLQDHIDLLPYRRIYLRHGKTPYQFEAIDYDVFMRYGRFLMVEGDAREVPAKVGQGQGVMVSEVFANQTGLTVGKRYQAQIGGTTLDLPILGIFRDYRTHGGVVSISLAHFQELSGDRTWSGVRLFVRDRHQDLAATAAQLRHQIISCCAREHGIELTLGGELHREILRIFDETFAITTVLLLIALLVAALGITTTLTVLVLERTRQLNTLLAIGASFAQIRAMIFWEAILLVSAGEIAGLGCGFMLSYLLTFVINRQSFGWTFIYSVDWSSLALSIPLILATALLAALPASQLAFRAPPAMILRER